MSMTISYALYVLVQDDLCGRIMVSTVQVPWLFGATMIHNVEALDMSASSVNDPSLTRINVLYISAVETSTSSFGNYEVLRSQFE